MTVTPLPPGLTPKKKCPNLPSPSCEKFFLLSNLDATYLFLTDWCVGEEVKGPRTDQRENWVGQERADLSPSGSLSLAASLPMSEREGTRQCMGNHWTVLEMI